MEFPFASRMYEPEVCNADVAGAAWTVSMDSTDSILTINNAVMQTAIGFLSLLAFRVFAIAFVFIFSLSS